MAGSVYGVFRILSSGSSLQQAAYDLKVVSSNLADGRTKQAEASLRLAQVHAGSARGKSDGPLIWLASRMPLVGADIAAVRTTARVVDDLAQQTLPKLVEASRGLSPTSLRPKKGRVALEPIKEAAPTLEEAALELDAAAEQVSLVDVRELAGNLKGPMTDIQRELAQAAALSHRGALAARLLPEMLGDKEPRTYALITQNNAEIRATGGIPGAVAIIRADKGRVRMMRQGTEFLFGRGRQAPILPLTPEEAALYGPALAIYPQSVNLSPDFPRSAQLLHAMWKEQQGESLDGILSVDPVVMAYILLATGPVSVPGHAEQLFPATLVSTIENLIYLLLPADINAQDDYFAKAGRAVFDTLVAGRAKAGTVLDALTTATSEGRIGIWSAHPQEQKLLQGTRISGSMPTEPSRSPQLGLYLNDAAADKMSYYLKYKTDVKPVQCNSDDSQLLDMKITFTSTAPKNVKQFAHVLSEVNHPPELLGVIVTTANLYAPFGGKVIESSIDGGELAANDDVQHLGRQVLSFSFDLQPGQTKVVDLRVRTGASQPGPVDLRTSPAALGDGRGEIAPSACR